MFKFLKDFYYNLVQHAHCICLLKVYFNVLKEKSKKQVNETAAVKNSLGAKDEPQNNSKEYINSGHNSVSENKELDIKTKNDVKKNIPKFLEQSNKGRATEENKTKDKNKAEAETENEKEAVAKEETGDLNKTEDKIVVSKVKKKRHLPIKFNLSKIVDIACITRTQDKFFAIVHLFKFNAFTNNKKTIIKITKENVIKITNFFFSQIMGKPAFNHLFLFIQLYNKHDNAKPDKRIAKQAQETIKRTINYTLKHFFKTVGKSEALFRGTNNIIH